MWFGVSIGAVSAVMQSASYIFSRRFVGVHRSSFKLVVYSQLLMGMMGAAVFAATLPFVSFPAGARLGKLALAMAVFVIAYHAAFFCFFRLLEEVEASRASSLLGLKVVVIALLTVPFTGRRLGIWHYAAIALTAFSAVGMNFSGMRIGRRGILYLLLSLLGFATTDITGAAFVKLMPGARPTPEAICSTALAYLFLGAIAAAVLAKVKIEPAMLRDALPYSALWFAAMLLLFASFGIVGVVYGSIIQASRGVISVILGVLLARTGYVDVEPDVSARLWVRRTVMAVVMVFAIGLYSWASAN